METYDNLAVMVRNGYRPKTMEEWLMADDDGWTLAHWYVSKNKPGESFPKELWEVADQDGWTVAHTAAACGKLPAYPNAPYWKYADKNGNSVVHTAVTANSLPQSWLSKTKLLKLYDKANHHGLTVWDEYLKQGRLRIQQIKEGLK